MWLIPIKERAQGVGWDRGSGGALSYLMWFQKEVQACMELPTLRLWELPVDIDSKSYSTSKQEP